MSKTCSFCAFKYPSGSPNCLRCGQPAPSGEFPNVVLATQKSELDALKERYDKSIQNAHNSGTLDKIREFENLVKTQSKLVTACGFRKFRNFAEKEYEVFPVFQRLLEAGIVFTDEEEQVNIDRLSAEEATLPGCSKDIRYAALTIDERGIKTYGDFLLIWNLDMIVHRTSLFHANCVEWRLDINLPLTEPAPLGHRCVWADRHRLATAKHAAVITSSTPESEYSHILLEDKSSDNKSDVFIEAHIWGPMTRATLAKVICRKVETDKVRKITLEEILSDLRTIGIEVEEKL